MSQENLYLENRKVLRVSGLNCVDFLNNINSGKNCNEQGCKIDDQKN